VDRITECSSVVSPTKQYVKLEFLLALLYTALYGRDIVLRIIIEYSGLRDFDPQKLGEMIHPNLVFNALIFKEFMFIPLMLSCFLYNS
jgi:hypothetical protein